MEFKRGDIVLIEELTLFPGGPGVHPDMHEYVGIPLTVAGKRGRWFCIKEDDGRFVWDSRWFCEVSPQKLKQIRKKNKNKNKPEHIVPTINRAFKRVKGSTSLCHFAKVFQDKKTGEIRFNYSLNAPCHYDIRWYDETSNVLKFFEYIGNYKKRIPERLQKPYKRFVKWMLNESPCADVFLTKDLRTALNYRIECDVNKTIGELIVALVMLRTATEYHSQILPIYAMLRKRGFSHETAWLVGCMNRPMDGKKGRYSRVRIGGHHILESSMNIFSVYKFLAKTGTFKKDEPYSKNGNRYYIEGHINAMKADQKLSITFFQEKYYGQPQGFGAPNLITDKEIILMAKEIEAELKKEKLHE